MSELQQFLDMGGYAFYVWTSYAVAFLVLAANVWLSARGLQNLRRQTLQRLSRQPPRGGRPAPETTGAADASTPSPLT